MSSTLAETHASAAGRCVAWHDRSCCKSQASSVEAKSQQLMQSDGGWTAPDKHRVFVQVSSAQLGSLARLAAGQPLASTTSAPSSSSSNGAGAEHASSSNGTEFRGAATSVAEGSGRFGDLSLDEFRCSCRLQAAVPHPPCHTVCACQSLHTPRQAAGLMGVAWRGNPQDEAFMGSGKGRMCWNSKEGHLGLDAHRPCTSAAVVHTGP